METCGGDGGGTTCTPSHTFPDAHQQVITYTDEDYYKILINEEWSKQETDRLVYFWNAFGGRFIIIADRYNYGLSDPSSFRPVEELKERLVEVMNKLNEARGEKMRSLITKVIQQRICDRIELDRVEVAIGGIANEISGTIEGGSHVDGCHGWDVTEFA